MIQVPEFFKYSGIVSVPLFAIIALFLLSKTQGYSLKKSTISKTITFLAHSPYRVIFRLNFLVKAILDCCFYLYLLDFFKVSVLSFIGLCLLGSALSFGMLAYFVEGKYSFFHKILVYGSGVLWVIGQIAIVHLLGKPIFFAISLIAIIAPLIIGFVYLFLRRTTVFVQIFCVLVWYVWVLVFVVKYL